MLTYVVIWEASDMIFNVIISKAREMDTVDTG